MDSSNNEEDDFAAFLETELKNASPSTDIDAEETKCRVKRLKVETDKHCPHPGSFKNMCVGCGRRIIFKSAVRLSYIHKDLQCGNKQMARIRKSNLEKLLRNKKLCLVLDLDHTLLNSTAISDMSPQEEYLKSQVDTTLNGSLFKLDSYQGIVKLRPFVRTFLEQASELYEMCIYTLGARSYALEMAKILDPEGIYFNSRVVSREDCTQMHQKNLDVLMVADSATVILDDSEHVWKMHRDNLILIERYHYFASSPRQFDLHCKTLTESKGDKNDADGSLSKALHVLKEVHQAFFQSSDADSDSLGKDVRPILKKLLELRQ